ncbi:fungal-specific transcription factor domain-containing protein [Aspergillus varians]
MPRREIAPGPSCLECRRRKIKCDRSHPCSYCVKVRINCRYPAARLPHDEDALTRVAYLESKLLAAEKRLSEIGECASPGEKGSHAVVSEAVHTDRPQKKYPIQSLATGSSYSPVGTRSSMILKPQAALDLDAVRPSQASVAVLWQQYVEAVDPLLKIFHTPTVQKLVVKAIHGREKLEAPSQCLLFAIYYAAVASMSPLVCKSELEDERQVLLKQYRTGVENLLSRLDLLNSTNMTVLQAFAIFLITGRCDEDGPDVYALVGLAGGMALKMGLNRDGAALGQSPFEVEMRRRLWWQLFILDIRVAEDRRSEPCILESSFNTRLPSNLGDADLHPDMSRLPACQEGRTEMLFSLVRFEGSYFARQMVFSDAFGEANAYMPLSMTEKCQALDLFQERMEKQYLSHCDDSIPLDNVTVRSIRLILAKLGLMAIDHTSTDVSPDERATTRRGWTKILQDAEELRRYEEGKQWLWLFQTYIEWDALASLLLHLHSDPVGGDGDEGWDTAYKIYSYWKNVKSTRRDRRWNRIEELRLEVLAARSQRAHATRNVGE